ncbi:hypothetical protein C8R45DRAFT_1077967 [Mycena sanguinolenta]|nr:hypothetical protein C8R45DRAFT_1077967 [Mycena sanguinolenta]
MALLLQNLAPDVIFSIFARCDIYSVVSASQTCRYLHDLAFYKSVWLTLLDNLRRRLILDRTSNLEDFSVAEMIGIVQRLITGPQTWISARFDREPVAEISKTITLHRQTEAGDSISNSVKLLPSGHPRTVEHTELVTFGAEETDADSIIIMICLREHLPGEILFIEIVNVDLRTGTYNCLLAARAPYSTFFGDPVICGALAAVRLDSGYMIINWREKSHFIIRGDCPQDWNHRFALIPQHIVVLETSFLPRIQIHLISNAATETYFSPTMGLDLISNDTSGTLFSPTMCLDDVAELSAVWAEEMPKLHTFHYITPQVFYDNVYLGMDIHASPIRDADYRVWIRGTSYGLDSFQLSIPDDREPQWRQRKAIPLPGVPSYSGPVLKYDGHEWGIGMYSPSSIANPLLRLFPDLDFVDSVELATYSGAITYLTDESTIVIQYYK